MEEFLSTLLHFQHFRQFINHKIEQLKNQSVARDLFDKEIMFYDEGIYSNVYTIHARQVQTEVHISEWSKEIIYNLCSQYFASGDFDWLFV